MGCYVEEVLADAPILYLRLGEPSGTTAVDEAAGAHDGTYVNTPTLGVATDLGDGDTAVTFVAASDEHVTAPDFAAADIGLNDYTIEFIFKTTSRNLGFIFEHNTDFDGIEAYWDGDHFLSRLNGIPVESGGAAGLHADGVRHHCAIVFDRSGNGQWWVDGATSGSAVDVSSASGVTLSGGDTIYVARRKSGNPIDATLDELALYDVALSSTRIIAHNDAITTACTVPTAAGFRPDYSAFPKMKLRRTA